MMSQVIQEETVIFLFAVLHGMILTFVYDGIRIFRRVVLHGLLAVSLEDLCFWILAGFFTFRLLFLCTDGILRGYVAAGIFLGFFLYHLTLSSWIVDTFSRLFRRCGKLLFRGCSAILCPIKKFVIFLIKALKILEKPYKIFNRLRNKG